MDTLTKKQIIILNITDSLGKGGTEKQLYLLCKHINPKIFKLYILVFNYNRVSSFDYSSKLNIDHVKLIYLPRICFHPIFKIIFLIISIYKIKPNIVQSWNAHLNGYCGILRYLFPKIFFIGSLRSSLYNVGFYHLNKFWKHISLRKVNLILVNSHSTIQELIDSGIKRESIVFIPNMFEISSSFYNHNVNYSADTIIRKDTNIIIGIIANLKPQKNHKLFVTALIEIMKKYNNILALLAGAITDIKYYNELIGIIDNSEFRDKFIILGSVEDGEITMRNIDIFCLTSNWEGFPNVVLEAMALGIPVIATKVGEIPYIIDNGINGLLIEKDDVKSLFNAIEKLLKEPTYARKIGLNGKEKVLQEYSANKLIHNWENLYLKVSLKRKIKIG